MDGPRLSWPIFPSPQAGQCRLRGNHNWTGVFFSPFLFPLITLNTPPAQENPQRFRKITRTIPNPSPTSIPFGASPCRPQNPIFPKKPLDSQHSISPSLAEGQAGLSRRGRGGEAVRFIRLKYYPLFSGLLMLPSFRPFLRRQEGG